MTDARLILICGLPGSGKTTVARKLAEQVPAARLCPDEWKHALAIDYYDEQARVRLEAQLWQLAQELLALGQSVILENGFWAREERDGLRTAARTLGVPVELHYLDAPLDELWRRLEIRNAQAEPGTAPIKRDDLEAWAQRFEAPDEAELALFDEPYARPVPPTRMDNVLIVVDDLDAAIALFTELGMELEGRAIVEGPSVDRVVAIDGVRSEIAMMKTRDGHGRIELDKFHAPTAVRTEPQDAPVNTLGIRRIMFAVDDIEDVVARLRTHGAELVGEIAQYENSYRLCYVRAPEGIIIGLAQQLS